MTISVLSTHQRLQKRHPVILIGLLAAFLGPLLGGLHAGVLGRFEHIRNVPGYLDLDRKKSYIYSPEKVLKVSSKPRADGIERRSPSRMLQEDYIRKDGLVNIQNIRKKIAEVYELVENAFLVYCSGKGHPDCRDKLQNTDSELQRKWQKKKIAVAGSFAVSELSRAIELAGQLPPLNRTSINFKETQDFLEALFQGLETYAAMRSERYDEVVNTARIIRVIKNFLGKVKITHTPEAVNLDIPRPDGHSSQMAFYHPRALQEAGHDLSRYDPVESGFWRRPLVPIPEFDTSNYNGQLRIAFGEKKFSQVADIQNPDISIDLDYQGPKKGGKTPKMKVKYKGLEMKLKFNTPQQEPGQVTNISDVIRFFMRYDGEVRSEFVANNLAAALGYTVDPTYYKKNIRLFLKDRFDLRLATTAKGRKKLLTHFFKACNKMVDELTEQIAKNNSIPINRINKLAHRYKYLPFMKNYGTVKKGKQKGRHFIKMQSVSLEFKRQQDTDWPIGLFHKTGFGKYLKREFRAFMLFYLWLADVDIKNDNASLGLVPVVPNGEGGSEKKIYYSAADMGATLGNVLGKNQPNYLGHNLVDQKGSRLTGPREQQVLALHSFYSTKRPLFKAVNFSDAKWITRMMAQLTKEQIKKSFLTANYPEIVAELFTQKLLRRRDQLVQALGLDGEAVRTYGRSSKTVKISGHTSDIVDPKSYFVPACESCFKSGELIRLPKGTKTDKNWFESLKVPSSETKGTIEILKKLLIATGAQILGRQLQRHQIGPGLTLDGVRVKTDSFLPARYLLENPYSDIPENKFWIVDVFRVGILVGVQEDWDWDQVDIWPNRNRFRGQAGVIETFEFIKVKPIKDSDSYSVKDLMKIYHPKNMIGRPLKKLKQSLIDSLQKGDLIITSRYLTFGASAYTKANFLSSGLGVSGAAFTSAVDRAILLKNTDTKALAAWSDISESGLKAGVFFDYLVGRFGLLAGQYKKLRERRQVYSFDLSQEQDKAILLNNINRDVPDTIPQKYAVESTYVKQSAVHFFASLFGLVGYSQYRKTTEMKLTNAEEKLLKDLVAVEKGRAQSGFSLTSLFRAHGTDSLALVDRLKGTIMATIDLKYMRTYATRKHYIKMVDQFKGLLPPTMVQFDDQSVNYYLGSLNLKGRILFSNNALRDILGQNLDKMSACQTFARYARLRWEYDTKLSTPDVIRKFCRRVLKENLSLDEIRHPDWKQEIKGREILFGVRSFIAKLRKAQKRFRQFETAFQKGHDTRKESRQLAHSIVNLLQQGSARGPAHMALISLTSTDKIYRKIKMNSSLEGFPGQKSELSLHKKQRGNSKLKKLPLWKLKQQPAQLLEMAMEPALTVLSPFFYHYYWSSGVDIVPPGGHNELAQPLEKTLTH